MIGQVLALGFPAQGRSTPEAVRPLDRSIAGTSSSHGQVEADSGSREGRGVRDSVSARRFGQA